MNLIPSSISGPFLGWAVLAAFVVGGAGGAYGGYRWAKSDVVQCKLDSEKRDNAQGKANAKENKRQTAASNRAARGLEADRGDIQTKFNEVRNEQTEAALAQPDRANLVCFDDEWLRLDAAATRAANQRGADSARAPDALPTAAGAQSGQGQRNPRGPDAPVGAVRDMRRDAQAPGRVDQAARIPETN